jgi:hypothetical protein
VFEVRGSTLFHCVVRIPEFCIPDATFILINGSCNVTNCLQCLKAQIGHIIKGILRNTQMTTKYINYNGSIKLRF